MEEREDRWEYSSPRLEAHNAISVAQPVGIVLGGLLTLQGHNLVATQQRGAADRDSGMR